MAWRVQEVSRDSTSFHLSHHLYISPTSDPNQSREKGKRSAIPFCNQAARLSSIMSIVRRSNVFDDPLHGLPFDTFLSLSESPPSETWAFANTRIDWKETPEAHMFKADLPGVKKEEVKVEVEDGRVLQISGERSRGEEENEKWHRVERSSGRFLRRFRLPENAKVDEVKASMEEGVLTVTVPKHEVKKPEVKAIEISG